MAMMGQRIEITQLPEGKAIHQNILSQRSLESISPDRLRCLQTGKRVESIKTTATGGNNG
jgi:hypothetical protein